MTHTQIEILKTLDRHKVPYLLTGGQAVNAHGFTRETEDVDIVWRRSSNTENELLAALTELKASYITNEKDPATGLEKLVPVSLAFIRAHHLMMLWTPMGFLDVFTYVPGMPEENVDELFDTAIDYQGRKFVSLQWLRRMKKLADRGKDRIDLENLPELPQL